MKKTALIIIAIMLVGVTLMAQTYRFVDARTGKKVALAKLAGKLQPFSAVFFGEWHDNADIHAAQIDLLERMHAKNKRLALSFEMFERDAQKTLDAYLAGAFTEEEFLADSRPWPNYATDYRPLVEFAKCNKLPVLAANVPRYLAGKAARSGAGFTSALTDEEASYVASRISAPEGAYRDAFMQTMEGMHEMMGGNNGLDNIYYAQCVKDDTMAESIVRFLGQNRKLSLIHFNGDFHSRGFLGTVERVSWRNPNLKIAVISPFFEGDILPLGDEAVATFYIIVPPVEAGEPQTTEE